MPRSFKLFSFRYFYQNFVYISLTPRAWLCPPYFIIIIIIIAIITAVTIKDDNETNHENITN
jgi:hypothetical protein